ncbi:hypothetical protein [Paraburkholderia sp. PGU19]|uniref:hypothetical protein n=1 Tax=Paraburkholderia sp. PGU19 TaxID=2735434 RepID=UPI0015DABB94|nr:hypothetical protein [Paraburkholderia sp. PGU19]
MTSVTGVNIRKPKASDITQFENDENGWVGGKNSLKQDNGNHARKHRCNYAGTHYEPDKYFRLQEPFGRFHTRQHKCRSACFHHSCRGKRERDVEGLVAHQVSKHEPDGCTDKKNRLVASLEPHHVAKERAVDNPYGHKLACHCLQLPTDDEKHEGGY